MFVCVCHWFRQKTVVITVEREREVFGRFAGLTLNEFPEQWNVDGEIFKNPASGYRQNGNFMQENQSKIH